MAYLTLNVNAFDSASVFLGPPIPNTVIPNSKFMRTGYSNRDLTLTSIHILVEGIKNCDIARWKEGVYVIPSGCEWAQQLVKIEREILSLVPNSAPRYKIAEQVGYGTLRLSEATSRVITSNIIVKMSGVWQTKTDCGLTYKVIPAA